MNAEEDKKFDEYMDLYHQNAQELIRRGQFSDARNFSNLVISKLQELIEKQPYFKAKGEKEIVNWKDTIQYANRKEQEYKEEKAKEVATLQAGDELFDTIKTHLDLGEAGEASQGIEEFLKKFPQHPKAQDVEALKEENEKSLQRSFASMRTKLETFLQAESYENAWIELYRFTDVMPSHPQAKELKELIHRQTEPKALQFYNQARVFEYEADDLVAAEQYYKKSLEVADPRSDLAKKAGRRYEEVRRKTIK